LNEVVIGSDGWVAETASNGRFILNSLLAMTYANIEASIFSGCSIYALNFR